MIERGMQATSLMRLPVQVPRWSRTLRTSDSSSARGRPLSRSDVGSGGTANGALSLPRPAGDGFDSETTGAIGVVPLWDAISAGGDSTSIEWYLRRDRINAGSSTGSFCPTSHTTKTMGRPIGAVE